MMLWIFLILLTGLILALLLWPLLRARSATAQRVEYDLAVYRDQLGELDKDIARGLLVEDQAEAARAEIYRRMLAAQDAGFQLVASSVEGISSLRTKIILSMCVLVFIPLAAGMTYAVLGSPELPGKPYASRQNDPDFVMAREAEKLAAQLEKKPDAAGFKHLADMYFMLRGYDRAVEAYQKTIEMSGGSATLWSELGESIALSQDERIGPDARQAFIKALQLNPQDARARFYMGLSEAQIGQPQRAVAIWRDLEKDSPVDAPWMPTIKEHIAVLSKEAGFDPDTIMPTPPSLDTVSADKKGANAHETPLGQAPTGAMEKQIMAMPAADQQAQIHKMVDGLAAKLKSQPDNLDGWLLLAKSYRVLGETDKAQEAENKAAALKAKGEGQESKEMKPPKD